MDVWPFDTSFLISSGFTRTKTFCGYVDSENFCAQHNCHWFDPLCDDDIAALVEFSERAKESSWYLSIVRVWMQKDTVKRAIVIQNKLNYLVFWNSNLSDFMAWYDAFDPEYPVLKNV